MLIERNEQFETSMQALVQELGSCLEDPASEATRDRAINMVGSAVQLAIPILQPFFDTSVRNKTEATEGLFIGIDRKSNTSQFYLSTDGLIAQEYYDDVANKPAKASFHYTVVLRRSEYNVAQVVEATLRVFHDIVALYYSLIVLQRRTLTRSQEELNKQYVDVAGAAALFNLKNW